MVISFLNKVLQVKNVFYFYIVLYMLSIASNPQITSARHVASITGNYALVTIICIIAALCAIVGAVVPFKPLRFWFLCSPFLAYAFMISYISLTAYDEKAWATIVTFITFILLAVCITWEKLNALD